jgi:hypothetical protein
MRLVLQILGVALILAGGLWALQGAGIVMWPESSFMLAQREWVLYGLITVAVGALLLWWARRRA